MILPVIVLLTLTVTVYLLLTTGTTSCNAANLTTNTDGEACQGELWILTCTGHWPILRWTLEIQGSIDPIMVTYTASGSIPRTMYKETYNFTLISAFNNWFESSVSTVLTTEINNTVAKCSDVESEEKKAIRIAGAPSSPQALMSRILESDTNYSRVEVTWEPPSNGSRVDFYHYKIVDLEGSGTSYTLYDAETTNTSTIILLSIPFYITFFLSATDNCGGKSTPIALLMNYSGHDQIDPLDTGILTNTESATTRPSIVIVIVSTTNASGSTLIPPQQTESQILLISISTLSVAIILSLVVIIICLVMALKHIVQSGTLSATCSSDSVNVHMYAELEPHDGINVAAEEWHTNEPEDEQDVLEAYEIIPLHDVSNHSVV